MEHPLVIGALLRTGLRVAPSQRITYRDQVEMTYAEFGDRVHRLLSIGPLPLVTVIRAGLVDQCVRRNPTTKAPLGADLVYLVRVPPENAAVIIELADEQGLAVSVERTHGG